MPVVLFNRRTIAVLLRNTLVAACAREGIAPPVGL